MYKGKGSIGERLGIEGERLNSLETAGIIHDIGKVGVPENILNKPEKLTPEEFEIIKKHCEIGETIIKPLSSINDCLAPIGPTAQECRSKKSKKS